MQNSLWLMISILTGAGAVGGLVNALTTENGFLFPRSERTETGISVLRPGCLGNVLIGAVAAVVSWCLYGPLAGSLVVALPASPEVTVQGAGLTLGALGAGFLVGVGGARWLSNEVDKNLLRAAASQAATKEPSVEAARQIAIGSPAQALRVAKAMK